VVIYHYADQISVAGSDAHRFSLGVAAYPELAGFAQFGWMGVPAFFVISGFVISFSASAATPGAFVGARILRLAPAVWICAPISAICIILSGQNGVMSVLGRLFNSMTFFPLGSQIDGVYWTLSIEVSFYFTVFVLLALGRFSLFSRYIYVIATVSAGYNVMLSLGFDQVHVFGKWSKLLLVDHGCEFALGAIAYRMHSDGIKAHRLLFFVVALVGTFAQTTPLLQGFDLSVQTIIWAVFLLVFLATVAANTRLLSTTTSASRRVVREIGKATYPLYLIHKVVGAYIIYLLITLGLHRYGALIVALLIVFLLTAGVTRLEPMLRERIRPLVARLSERPRAVKAPDVAAPEAVSA
jgi:peptidoglycan/LPS O-acetylase OafA/YrhL